MRDGVRGWLGSTSDRLLASDPGLGRFRMAASAVLAMGTALAVEYAVATATGAPAAGRLIAMLLGAVVAMMGSMALTGSGAWSKLRTAAFFPVAIGVGLAAGTAVGRHTDLMLAVFVLVMFLAVFVRRFGLPFFFYGFMAWMGYFFASFLQTTLAALPSLMVAVVVATGWLVLLSVTVLRTNPRKVLRSTWRAYLARGRSVARACAELLETNPADQRRHARWRRRLSARQAGLAEAALMMEGWSEEPGALAPDWSGVALRRRLLEIQHTLDRVAGAATTLAEEPSALTGTAHHVADRLARNDAPAARRAAELLISRSREAEEVDAPGWWPALHLASGALEFLDLSARAGQPPVLEPNEAEFSATAPLMMGNLPGSPAVASGVRARGTSWNPVARLDMTSRQAVQVSAAAVLAIVLGREVSAARYYWAVIAAFVVFTGTGSRTETFLKGFNRVLGTLLGLFASVWLAHLTAGRTPWVLAVILASMFLGFYLLRISYAYMIFFVTIMIGQLYSALHQFSSGLLVLRLEETAVGAAAGIVVALLVTPLSTRDTVRAARDDLLGALGELLTGAACRVERDPPRPDLDALARALDDRVRRLALVAQPLAWLWGAHNQRTRHRLRLYQAVSAQGRALAAALHRGTGEPECVAAACRALADAAERLTEASPGRPVPSLEEPLARADSALFQHASRREPTDEVLRPLGHLHRTLAELAASNHGITARPEPASGA
ncbi:MAG TPA: FUSC family protein [Nocardioidaceae bacterium]|nr:FUSC family protein [Nocardioidaceae bacterium]